jgi:hypothetical protein
MSKIDMTPIILLRCPCCNEELTEYEIDLYDLFGGMKETCFNESMGAAYDHLDEEALKNVDLDSGE